MYVVSVNVLATVSISTLLVLISNKGNHYRASALLKRVAMADIYSKDSDYVVRELLKRVSTNTTADMFDTSALKKLPVGTNNMSITIVKRSCQLIKSTTRQVLLFERSHQLIFIASLVILLQKGCHQSTTA